MIKTLIVDDSPLVRAILRDFLESEGSFEIAAEAENGQEAVSKAKELNPDLITMDFHMPLMNGLEAIEEIRKFSACGIVMISTHDTAKMAYDATVKGAHDFFAKDIFTTSMTDIQRSEIFNTLKQISNIKKKAPTLKENIIDSSTSNQKISCIVIAASTGGPMALCQLCSGLPADFKVPILLVQHNTSGFDKGFVQWLDGYASINVVLAENDIVPSKGYLYVAPTDKHLIIGENGIDFDHGEPINNQKPAADMLFKSATKKYGSELVGVVLTGMGSDGAEGIRCIKEAGGITIAQDEASSMIYSMPQSALQTGCVDLVLPLDKIAHKLVSLAAEG